MPQLYSLRSLYLAAGLVLGLSVAARPAAAQTADRSTVPVASSKVEAARPAPGASFAINTITTRICAGGTALLSVSSGMYVTGPYSWSPNKDLSANNGTQVIVAPLQTTTYTVTGYNIFDGSPAQTSITIDVDNNCCQYGTAGSQIIELGNYYDYNPGPTGQNPFSGGSAARYHVTGNLTLYNNQFTLPAGSVLLMDPGATITVDDAILNINGATITATCDEMWGGILVTGHNHGFNMDAVGTLRSRIMHSYDGVAFEENAPGSVAAPFHINSADFLQNRQSLAFHRNVSRASTTDYVIKSTFDSDPQYFKAPWNYDPGNYHYSQQHILLDGNVSPASISYNTFAHTVYGVYSQKNKWPGIRMENNQFRDFYLAGFYVPDPGTVDDTRNLSFVNNSFAFPTNAALPGTSQIDEAVNDMQFPRAETFGIYAGAVQLAALNNRFTQADSSRYAGYDFEQTRSPQTGILTERPAQVQNNRFYLLHTGLEHQATPMNITTPSAMEIKGNGFVNCAKGMLLTGVAAGGSPALFATCNTFLRDDWRSKTAYGIYFTDMANVRLDDPNATPTTATLKNRFVGPKDPAKYYHLYKAGGPITYYTTFVEYKPLTITNALVGVAAGQNVQRGVNTCDVDGYNGGIQSRGVAGPASAPVLSEASQTVLAQNAPNPTDGRTTITYQLRSGTKRATLQVRESTSGRVVHTQELAPSQHVVALDLTKLPAGVYFYSLQADGTPTPAKRLLLAK